MHLTKRAAQVKSSESAKTLQTVSKDLNYPITRFESLKEVQQMKSFALMQRVFSEQCELKENTKMKEGSLEVQFNPAKQIWDIQF